MTEYLSPEQTPRLLEGTYFQFRSASSLSLANPSFSGKSPTPAGDATTPTDLSQLWPQVLTPGGEFEVVYDQRALSECTRLGKNGRVLGMAVDQLTEASLAVWTSEGRICLLEVQKGE